MKYRLQCNFCSETFVHIGNAFPTHCPLCFAYVGLNGKPEVTLPFISKAANKSPDVLNRAMEEGAQHRINLAAEATGSPTSDFASMKHTNMKDNLHEGDTSFVPTKTPDDFVVGFGNRQGGNIDPNIIAGVGSGAEPNMGARQIPKINDLHRKYSGSIVRRGSQGRHG